MDIEIVNILSEEIRETKNLTFEVKKQTDEIRILAQEAKRQADAAWELVVMTRNQINRPWWKRVVGVN